MALLPGVMSTAKSLVSDATMQAPWLFDHSVCTVQVWPCELIVPCEPLQMSPISPFVPCGSYQASGGALLVARPTSASVTDSISSCEATEVVLLNPPPMGPQPSSQPSVVTLGMTP
jgi:hypothetical protein